MAAFGRILTVLIGLALALSLVLGPGRAAAQGWQLRTFDDGSFFLAAISTGPTSALTLLCGEKSPKGLSPYQTGNTEPDITAPGVLRAGFDHRVIGAPVGGYEPSRGDVILVAGGQGFRLPNVTWNELTYQWEANLSATDPLFAAMRAGGSFELHSRAGRHAVPGAGFGEVFGQLTSYCQNVFASIGKPWPGAAAPQGANVATARGSAPGVMSQVAENAIVRGCNGPAARAAGYLLAGNIDGDGREDMVLDWSRISCLSGHPRPFCGASLCSAQVFLTARPGARPFDLLAQDVRLQPLSNGAMAVAIGGSLSMCQNRGGGGCERLFWWNGVDLIELR